MQLPLHVARHHAKPFGHVKGEPVFHDRTTYGLFAKFGGILKIFGCDKSEDAYSFLDPVREVPPHLHQ
jgi:hypothetical protein